MRRASYQRRQQRQAKEHRRWTPPPQPPAPPQPSAAEVEAARRRRDLKAAEAYGYDPEAPATLQTVVQRLLAVANSTDELHRTRRDPEAPRRRAEAGFLADRLQSIFNTESHPMRISETFPSASVYLAAKHLPPNQDVHATIQDCVNEHLALEGDKPALVFVGRDKKLLLNKTNLSVLVDSFGDETDHWRGKRIILFVTRTQFNGQMVPGIRIRVPEQQPVPRPQPEPARTEYDDEIPF